MTNLLGHKGTPLNEALTLYKQRMLDIVPRLSLEQGKAAHDAFVEFLEIYRKELLNNPENK